MPSSHRERAACPLYTAIGVIEGRWKPMLFQRLARVHMGSVNCGDRCLMCRRRFYESNCGRCRLTASLRGRR